MSEKLELSKDFEPINDEVWKEKIIQELKGKPFEETLISKDYDGIETYPFYTKNSLKDTIEIPFKSSNEWLIVEYCNDENHLKQALDNDVDIIKTNNSPLIEAVPITKTILIENNINLEQLPQTINNQKCFILKNIFADALLNGNWEHGLENQLAHLETIVKTFPNSKTLIFDGSLLTNCGATPVQEISTILLQAAYIFNYFTEKGFTIDDLIKRSVFKVGVTTDFFKEISKIRALRYLLFNLIKAYQPSENFEENIFIHAETAVFNLSVLDHHTNLLRITTQAFSAVLGNCNSLEITPFNLNHNDLFSKRIARNIHHLLKHESFVNNIVDIGSGAYYIENLTRTIVQKSWDKFLSLENKGGIIPYIENNNLQNEVNEVFHKKSNDLKENITNMVGVNLHINEKDNPIPEYKFDYKHNDKPAVFQKLTPTRLSKSIEKELKATI